MGKLERAVTIADLRRMGRARLPAVVFDYLDGAAEAEVTLRDNMRAFRRWQFRPRLGVEIPEIGLSVTVMGQKLAWPAMAAPIGYSALMHRDGERGTARAVKAAGLAQNSVHHFRRADGGCGGDRRAAVHADLSFGRTGSRRSDLGTCCCLRCEGSVPHHRHACGRTAGTRPAQRNGTASGRECICQAALSSRHAGASALGGRLSDGRQHAQPSQCCDSR